MREGWICSRCKASVSPDAQTCPACSLTDMDLTPRSPDPRRPIPFEKFCFGGYGDEDIPVDISPLTR